jgi:hypothetical protein
MSQILNVEEVRNRIESIPEQPYQVACKTLYLFAGRVSEIVSRAYAYEKSYGIRKNDVLLDSYKTEKMEHAAVVFRVQTAKRKGLIRNIGLPLEYEPWAREVYGYFQECQGDFVFPFTRQKLWREVRGYFKGLTYPIEEYVVLKNGELRKIPSHQHRFALHALRHLRSTELVERYGFDGFNLAAYCGWTIMTAQAQFGVRVPRVIARYLYLNWQGYFPKLLKRR